MKELVLCLSRMFFFFQDILQKMNRLLGDPGCGLEDLGEYSDLGVTDKLRHLLIQLCIVLGTDSRRVDTVY